MQPLPHPPRSSFWLLASASLLSVGILASWLRIGLIVLGVWLLLLVIALVLAQRLRQPIVRVIVRGHPGLGQQIDVQGWWPHPNADEIQAYVATLELPIGSELWARRKAEDVEVRSNLHDGAAIEAALARFLNETPPLN